jgi:hypothetical protein
MQAKEKSEAPTDELYSLSDWYKISVRSLFLMYRRHERALAIYPRTKNYAQVGGERFGFRPQLS